MDLILDELFAGFGDAAQMARGVIRLLVAGLLGAVVGLQRERTGKAAGLRTHMLVSAGAAIFVLAPLQSGMGDDALSRVIQGLTTGIGFIGGGAILKLSHQQQVQGLTTAAGIWMTAGVGVAAGLGRHGTALAGALLTWVILAIEGWMVAREPAAGGPDGADN